MENLIRLRLFLFMPLLFASPVWAYGLQILTEEDPPYSLTGKDGRPTGYGVEVVSEIQKRVNNHDVIKIYPWARAYNLIKKQPGVVVFTMSITKEREPLFQWVGPIIENSWVFVAKKSSQLKLNSLDDARALPFIGVVRDYAWDKYLTNQGFTNLDRAAEYASNINKTAMGRIPAFVSANLSYQHELTMQGQKVEDYEVLMEFNKVQMYIAHSKQSDKAMVQAWQAAFDDMKKDGTVARLLKKWIPNAQMPGAAKPASF